MLCQSEKVLLCTAVLGCYFSEGPLCELMCRKRECTTNMNGRGSFRTQTELLVYTTLHMFVGENPHKNGYTLVLCVFSAERLPQKQLTLYIAGILNMPICSRLF